MPDPRHAKVSATTRTVLVMNRASWTTYTIMISSVYLMTQSLIGPVALFFAFGLRLHALDNHQFRVSRGLAQRLRLRVFWRIPPLLGPFHARKLGDDQPFARPLTLENVNRSAASNESPTVLLHRWHHRTFVILKPNRIFDRKTCNDIN